MHDGANNRQEGHRSRDRGSQQRHLFGLEGAIRRHEVGLDRLGALGCQTPRVGLSLIHI